MSEMDVQTGAAPGLSFEADRQETERKELYLDGTLVLVGCGKAKRDPDDPTDCHVASTPPGEPMSSLPNADTGPAWRAEDLYTSSYFAVKRHLGELLTAWARGYDAGQWAVLSAEHAVVPHYRELKPYDTSIDDLGSDSSNPDHRVPNPYGRRRPDGREIVTEMDAWASMVAAGLCKWIAGYRPEGAPPWQNDATQLLVLAGQDYIEPLRERGVFEYGIARQTGDPNEGATFPLDVRYLFEEIPAGGYQEQMAWLSDAVSKLEPFVSEEYDTGQTTLSAGGGR